jgi:hypothetical protein
MQLGRRVALTHDQPTPVAFRDARRDGEPNAPARREAGFFVGVDDDHGTSSADGELDRRHGHPLRMGRRGSAKEHHERAAE